MQVAFTLGHQTPTAHESRFNIVPAGRVAIHVYRVRYISACTKITILLHTYTYFFYPQPDTDSNRVAKQTKTCRIFSTKLPAGPV